MTIKMDSIALEAIWHEAFHAGVRAERRVCALIIRDLMEVDPWNHALQTAIDEITNRDKPTKAPE